MPSVMLAAVAAALLLVPAAPRAQVKRTDVPGYGFVQLTDNDRLDWYPRVSPNGMIVWIGAYNHDPNATSGDLDQEVMLWNGVTIRQITDNNVIERRPVVNNFGSMAFQTNGDHGASEIVTVLNGVVTTQVTNDPLGDTIDRYPDVNGWGRVTWARRPPGGAYHVVIYNLLTPSIPFQPLGPPNGYRPHINHRNHIEFYARDLYDLSGSVWADIPSGPELGYVSWRRSELNDVDEVAIEASFTLPPADYTGPRDILFWDGSGMELIFRHDEWAGRPDLNASGVIAFEGFGGLPGSTSSPADREIFVYNPVLGNVIQLTDDDGVDDWPTVTANGTIVWAGELNYPGAAGNPGDLEIQMAVPNGDADGDGRLDVQDNCPLEPNPSQSDTGGVGPGSGPDGIGTDCQCGDVDDSGRVELADVDLIRVELTGAASGATHPERCSVAGDPGAEAALCELMDRVALERTLAGLGPGLLQRCGPAHAWQ